MRDAVFGEKKKKKLEEKKEKRGRAAEIRV